MSLITRQGSSNGTCVIPTCPIIACPNCADGFVCQETVSSCATCGSAVCVPQTPSTPKPSSVSPGVVAAAVILSILFLIGAVVAFWWYRRRNRAIRAAAEARVFKEAAPKSEDVLNRPDPHEKAQQLARASVAGLQAPNYHSHNAAALVQQSESETQRVPHPYAQVMHENPFEDGQSIRTTSAETQSTNVIPIALVPPGTVSRVPSTAAATNGSVFLPSRPVRSPELDADIAEKAPSKASFNLEHTNVSNDSFPPKPASDIAARVPGDRSSYMTTGTFASDVLSEAPMIVTANKSKVMSVSKAEFIQVTSPTTASHDSLKPPGPARASRAAPGRSPLAQAAFNAADLSVGSSVVMEDEQGQEVVVRSDPFSDEHTAESAKDHSDSTSISTFGSPLPTNYGGSPREDRHSGVARPESDWVPKEPTQPWADKNTSSDNRSSIYTTASSIVAEVGSATRVNFGLVSPNLRSPHRVTAARIVGAGDGAKLSALPGPLAEQQQRALAIARQAQAMTGRRMSDASAVSATADSILESFTFVPPSPISATPPRSPNKPIQSFRTQQLAPSRGQQGQELSLPVTPQPPTTPQTTTTAEQPLSPLMPPSRHKFALSTVSQSSAISNGLGEYAFRLGGESQRNEDVEAHPQSVEDVKVGSDGKQRASLDTLALTNDLSAYPLNFDRQREASWNDLMEQQKR